MEMKNLMYPQSILNGMYDWLSIYFAFIIMLVFIPVAIYSIGYVKGFQKDYSIKYFWIMMITFVASMLGVVLSSDSITFMVFWEVMSIASFFLVIYEYKNKDNIKSGIMYFIMTHISGLALLVMFGLIYKYTGSMNFSEIVTQTGKLTGKEGLIIFIFATIGFGAKSALIPLHAWLPKAYPCAPSNITALMSGVMVKVAIYGFIKVAFLFIGKTPVSYGVFIMILGIATAVFSIANALFQNDIKKLLAYSSAENVGIIFSALGLAMIFRSYGLNTLEVVTLTGALLHSLNHGVFKGLLFTNAGSVQYATSTRNMNELGGLYSKMKFATICAFIGTVSMASIPPLNGFTSEILILQSFVKAGTAIGSVKLILLIILCGVLLAIISGGALYAAAKSFGITYLGEARSEKVKNINKIPQSMNVGMGILSVYSIALGILSPMAINYISRNTANILGLSENLEIINYGMDITIVSAIMAAVILILAIINKVISKNSVTEENETWGCGFNNPKPYMQYSGSGYTQPASRFVGGIAGYRKEVRVRNKIILRQKTVDVIEQYVYSFFIKLIDCISTSIVKIHYGKIQLYISYVFISLIIAIVMVIKFV
jgi:hydrogenase-4 component B